MHFTNKLLKNIEESASQLNMWKIEFVEYLIFFLVRKYINFYIYFPSL